MNECEDSPLRPLWVYQNLSTTEFIEELGYDLMLAEYGVTNVEAEPDGTLTRKDRTRRERRR